MQAFKCDCCKKLFEGKRHHELSITIDKYSSSVIRITDLCNVCFFDFLRHNGIVLTEKEMERIKVSNAN